MIMKQTMPDRPRRFARSVRDESGAVLILVAVALVVLMGFVGLAVDVGGHYNVKRSELFGVKYFCRSTSTILAGSDGCSFDDAPFAGRCCGF